MSFNVKSERYQECFIKSCEKYFITTSSKHRLSSGVYFLLQNVELKCFFWLWYGVLRCLSVTICGAWFREVSFFTKTNKFHGVKQPLFDNAIQNQASFIESVNFT